jgi:hypothetical protein
MLMKFYNSPCVELQYGTVISVVECIIVEKSSWDGGIGANNTTVNEYCNDFVRSFTSTSTFP